MYWVDFSAIYCGETKTRGTIEAFVFTFSHKPERRKGATGTVGATNEYLSYLHKRAYLSLFAFK